MTNRLGLWVLWFSVLVLAAFVVPFLLLSEITSVYGAFLFWGVFAVAAIASVVFITSGWRD